MSYPKPGIYTCGSCKKKTLSVIPHDMAGATHCDEEGVPVMQKISVFLCIGCYDRIMLSPPKNISMGCSFEERGAKKRVDTLLSIKGEG